MCQCHCGVTCHLYLSGTVQSCARLPKAASSTQSVTSRRHRLSTTCKVQHRGTVQGYSTNLQYKYKHKLVQYKDTVQGTHLLHPHPLGCLTATAPSSPPLRLSSSSFPSSNTIPPPNPSKQTSSDIAVADIHIGAVKCILIKEHRV